MERTHAIKIFIVVTGLCALVYLAVQQDYRQSANDPQIQMAEDAAAQLTEGRAVENVVPGAKVDIAKSLAPCMTVYNSAGMPVFSSCLLNGAMPTLSQGLFDSKEKRVTWQPQPGVRQALVLVETTTPGGVEYVAASRSLREVEDRESALTKLILLAWLAILAGLFAVHTFFKRLK